MASRSIFCFSALLGLLGWLCCADHCPAAEVVDTQARIAALQKAREQCSDQDPDIRLAHIEAAIAGNDEAIKRMCLNLALKSDNSDIRYIGMKGIVSSLKQIAFTPTLPNNVKVSDSKKTSNTTSSDRQREGFLNSIKGGVIIEKGAENGEELWYSKCAKSKKNEENAGILTVDGTHLRWNGRIDYKYLHGSGNVANDYTECSFITSLKESGKLEGTMSCSAWGAFEVTGEIF